MESPGWWPRSSRHAVAMVALAVAVMLIYNLAVQVNPAYATVGLDNKLNYSCVTTSYECYFQFTHGPNVLIMLAVSTPDFSNTFCGPSQACGQSPYGDIVLGCIGPPLEECSSSYGGQIFDRVWANLGWVGGVGLYYVYRTSGGTDYILVELGGGGSPQYASFVVASFSNTASSPPYFNDTTTPSPVSSELTSTPSVSVPAGSYGRRVVMVTGISSWPGCDSITSFGPGQVDVGNVCTAGGGGNQYQVDLNYKDDNGAGTTMSLTLGSAQYLTPIGTAILDPASSMVPVTVNSSPAGSGYVTVDGSIATTPVTFNWIPGSTHTFSASSPVNCGSGCQVTFNSWTSSSIGTVNSASFTYTTPNAGETVTANYRTQYQLTMAVGSSGSGSTSPAVGSTWENAGASVSISATANAGYTFQSWSGSGTGSYSGASNPATVTMSGPITETAKFVTAPPITVTWQLNGVGSDASGTILTIDGSGFSYQALPRNFNWIPGSTHTVAATTPVPGNSGVEYVFSSWTNGDGLSGASGTYTTPSSSSTVTANFNAQYQLTMAVSPSGSGSTTPAVGSVWENAGASVSISATANAGYGFQSWSGSGTGSYTGASNSVTVTLNGPLTETANFGPQTTTVTVTSNPTGSSFVVVDNSPITTPQTFNWQVDSAHTVAANSPVPSGSGTQYVWTSWSDGDSQSHQIITPSSAATYTANFNTQYRLTMAVNPSSGGMTNPSASEYWQNAGASISISASANGGYVFQSWVGSGPGSYTGTSNPATITVNGPIIETANFTVTSSGGGGSSSGTGGSSITIYLQDSGGNPIVGVPVSIDGVNVGSTDANGNVAANVTQGTHSVTADGITQQINVTGNTGTFNITVPATSTNSVTVTVTSNPSGPGFESADSIAVVTPENFNWTVGSKHTLSANSPVSCGSSSGCEYTWLNWSDGGAQAHSVTTPSSTVTYTASFKLQYQLSINVNPQSSGTVNPAAGTYWYPSGSSVVVEAYPTNGSKFVGWTLDGSNAGSANYTTVVMNQPHSLNATFQLALGSNVGAYAKVTVTSNPSGSGFVTVDGSPITAPQTFNWTVGTTHTLSANSPVSCGLNCVYVWQNWSDGGTQSHMFTVPSSSVTVTAHYETATPGSSVNVTFSVLGVGSDTADTILTIDGFSYTYSQLPVTVTWVEGSSHTISAKSPLSAGSSGRYVWMSWSDGGAQAHTIIASVSTYTADYGIQYLLTTLAQPAYAGSASPITGLYGAGATVKISATPSANFTFQSWSGSGAGSYSGVNNPATVTMNGPITETANFAGTQPMLTVSSLPVGLVPQPSVSPGSAPQPGEQVTVTAPAVAGWNFKGFSVTGVDATVNGQQATFTMPNNAVIVYANYQYAKPPTGVAVPAYDPTLVMFASLLLASMGLAVKHRQQSI